MKRYFFIICFAFIACILISCDNKTEEYMANVTIIVNCDDAKDIDRIQATATITNLNSKQVFRSVNFIKNTLTEVVLRGAYKITLDGVIRYIDKNNKVRVRTFRSTTNFVSITGSNDTHLLMQTIFTD